MLILNFIFVCRVTGGELFEDIVAREFYSEADARYLLLEYLCIFDRRTDGWMHFMTRTSSHN